jgi:ABC-type amino acid transport substrate-binding protein
MLWTRWIPRTTRLALLLLLLAPATAIGQANHATPKLRVAVYDDPPFSMQDPSTGAWKGLALELFHDVADRMGLEYEIQAAGSLALAFAKIGSGEADVVAGAVPITLESVDSVEFTTPFLSKGYSIATPPREASVWTDLLGGPLGARFRDVGIATAVLLVGGALVLWWLERDRNPEHFGGKPTTGIGNALWWSATTMTTVGYGDRTPVTIAGRIVAVFSMFVSLALVSVLTGIIASRLTVVEMRTRITTVADLAHVRVGCVATSPMADFLQHRAIPFQGFPQIEEAADALVAGQLDAILGGEAELHFIGRNRHPGKLAVLPGLIDQGFVAFALPQGSALRHPMNKALQAELEGPDWARIRDEYLQR